MKSICRNLTLMMVAAMAANVSATEVTLNAVRDGGYFDLASGFNLGAHTHVPVGQANNARVNRSVFDFDILATVPSGATINSVTFQFLVTQQGGPQGMAGATFDLHRVTRSWDEGTGAADTGEATGDGATWDNATAAELWTTPGGDFDATISGSTFVNGPAIYTISSAQLVADLQAIVDGTATDFGFLMKANTDIPGSAARIASRESGNPAQLIIDFDAVGVLLGDVNLDGIVSLLDVAPFVNRLTSGTFQAEADINLDGIVSLLDVAPFVQLLTGG